jgi:hypothetical protein
VNRPEAKIPLPTKCQEAAMLKIDFHCHSFPAELFEALKRHYPDIIDLKRDAEGRLYAIWANTALPAGRIEDIDPAGIDRRSGP